MYVKKHTWIYMDSLGIVHLPVLCVPSPQRKTAQGCQFQSNQKNVDRCLHGGQGVKVKLGEFFRTKKHVENFYTLKLK